MFYISVLESTTYFMSVAYKKNKDIKFIKTTENYIFFLEN